MPAAAAGGSEQPAADPTTKCRCHVEVKACRYEVSPSDHSVVVLNSERLPSTAERLARATEERHQKPNSTPPPPDDGDSGNAGGTRRDEPARGDTGR